jgi:hypothetical protein
MKCLPSLTFGIYRAEHPRHKAKEVAAIAQAIHMPTLLEHPVVCNKSILHEIRRNKAEDYSICRYM